MDKDYARDGYKVISAPGLADRLNKIKFEIVEIFNTQFQRLNISKGSFISWEDGLVELFKNNPEVFINCAKQSQSLISIYKLILDDYMIDIVKNVAGLKQPNLSSYPVVTFSNKNMAKKEENWRTGRHQDIGSTGGSLNSCVVWAGLTDITESLGRLKCWPGSHLHGGQWTHLQDNFARCDHYKEEDSIDIPTRLGDVVIFSQLLVHASGTNLTSNSPRMAVSARFNDLADLSWIDNGYYSPYHLKLDNFGEFKPTTEEAKKVFNAT